MPGPEDMQVDHRSGKLFISSTERRTDDKADNGIYMLEIASSGQPIKMQTTLKGEFNPHGISLFRKDSVLLLFVINHTQDGDKVEKFRVEGEVLEYESSFSSKLMCCPNDLVAIGHDQFYVTNDHGSKAGFSRAMEDYLRIPRASIVFYNGVGFETVAKPFHYANGINISKDKKFLYLAETTGAAISIFEIEANGDLQQLNSVDVGTGVDNIDIDEEGNLWVAAHPKLLDFVQHQKDSINLSPSEVIKLIPIENNKFRIERIYMNDGTELSGSSVAIRYNDNIFIGTVLNRQVLRVKLN